MPGRAARWIPFCGARTSSSKSPAGVRRSTVDSQGRAPPVAPVSATAEGLAEELPGEVDAVVRPEHEAPAQPIGDGAEAAEAIGVGRRRDDHAGLDDHPHAVDDGGLGAGAAARPGRPHRSGCRGGRRMPSAPGRAARGQALGRWRRCGERVPARARCCTRWPGGPRRKRARGRLKAPRSRRQERRAREPLPGLRPRPHQEEHRLPLAVEARHDLADRPMRLVRPPGSPRGDRPAPGSPARRGRRARATSAARRRPRPSPDPRRGARRRRRRWRPRRAAPPRPLPGEGRTRGEEPSAARESGWRRSSAPNRPPIGIDGRERRVPRRRRARPPPARPPRGADAEGEAAHRAAHGHAVELVERHRQVEGVRGDGASTAGAHRARARRGLGHGDLEGAPRRVQHHHPAPEVDADRGILGAGAQGAADPGDVGGWRSTGRYGRWRRRRGSRPAPAGSRAAARTRGGRRARSRGAPRGRSCAGASLPRRAGPSTPRRRRPSPASARCC